MRVMIIGVLLLASCTDEQNLGNTSGSGSTQKVFSNTRWALTLGDIHQDGARGLAMDSKGDVVAAGYFDGAIDFGTQTLTTPQIAGFVTKRAGADGSERWTVPFGTEAGARADAASVAVGPDDSVVVAGTYSGTFHIGTHVFQGPGLTVGTDCFLAKYDASGHLIWARAFGGICYNASIAVGGDGRIAMIATFQGGLTFPNGTFTGPMTDGAPLLVLVDTDGNSTWAAVGTKGMTVEAVAMTGEDDSLITGDVIDYTIYQGTLMTANAYESQYVARWTVNGHLLWAGLVGESGVSRYAGPISVDPNGAAILAATTRPDSTISDNGQPLVDVLDPAGHGMWTAQARSGSAMADAMTRLADGSIVIGGYTAGFPIDFGDGQLRGLMYLAAYSDSGSALDAVTFVPKDSNCAAANPWKLASQPGSLSFAGVIGCAADFGTGQLRFAGATDAMIVMIDTPQ